MYCSDRGFFLLDSLLAVFILSCLCILCFSIHELNGKYEEGYRQYQERSNQFYEDILSAHAECESCIYEPD